MSKEKSKIYTDSKQKEQPLAFPLRRKLFSLLTGLRSSLDQRQHDHGLLDGREATMMPHGGTFWKQAPCNLLEIHLLQFLGNLFMVKFLTGGTPLQNLLIGGAGGSCWLPGTAEVGYWRHCVHCRSWTPRRPSALQELCADESLNARGNCMHCRSGYWEIDRCRSGMLEEPPGDFQGSTPASQSKYFFCNVPSVPSISKG